MEQVDLIIHARWLIPVDRQQSVLEDHAVVVDKGQIVAIAPQDKVRQYYTASLSHEFHHHCIMPGLINMHTHAAMSLFRGLADDLPLMTWLNEHIWPAEQRHVSEAFVKAGSELAIAEMLRGGTTCFNDMYFFPDTTAQVVDQSGIRACLGMLVMDFPSAWAHSVDDYLLKGIQLHDHYRHHPRITTAYAPHAPYTVRDQALENIVMNAEEMDIPIHMHIHETASEIAHSLKEYGVRPLQRLNELGLLSPRLLAVHMTQINEQDHILCQNTGIHIIHCPESNLKLASGFCPIAQLHDAGINLCIGTDGAASNNDLDMFAEMHQTAILAKAVAQNPSAIPAHTAIEMATINAATALGLANKIGSLETGKAADLIAIDMSQIESQPCYDIASQIVYATGRDKVTDVWVDGRHLLAQRQLTTFSEQHIIHHAQHWANTIKVTQS